jgi:nucleotide-binding universal stress UspA family protein
MISVSPDFKNIANRNNNLHKTTCFEVIRMKILVGYDKVESMDPILKIAKEHAVAFNATLLLLTSLIVSTADEEEAKEKALLDLKASKAIFENEGTSCEIDVLARGLSEEEDLISYATEKQVDMVIIGARKRSKIEKLIMGSVTQYVVLKSECPVLTVKTV